MCIINQKCMSQCEFQVFTGTWSLQTYMRILVVRGNLTVNAKNIPGFNFKLVITTICDCAQSSLNIPQRFLHSNFVQFHSIPKSQQNLLIPVIHKLCRGMTAHGYKSTCETSQGYDDFSKSPIVGCMLWFNLSWNHPCSDSVTSYKPLCKAGFPSSPKMHT